MAIPGSVDGKNPAITIWMDKKPVNKWDIVTTSAGAGFLPLVVLFYSIFMWGDVSFLSELFCGMCNW